MLAHELMRRANHEKLLCVQTIGVRQEVGCKFANELQLLTSGLCMQAVVLRQREHDPLHPRLSTFGTRLSWPQPAVRSGSLQERCPG